MRIAQIAPLYESVPPKMYGGTERVVYGLTEELVRRGHQVTLFASGDSHTSAHLVPVCERGLRLARRLHDAVAFTTIELGMVYERAGEFDIIHNHADYFAFPFARLTRTPTLTTLHGRLDLEEVQRVYRYFPEAPLVSISFAQRQHLPRANWVANVYNGIVPEHFVLRKQPGEYLVFLGRISPEKRPDRAIEIARAVDMPLRIAAKVDPADSEYFKHAIKPLLDHPLVEFVGEVDEAAKDELLGGAYAYLFPVDWPEPFGITMVEAMATGTPVIASACGAVPEVVVHGRTGFVCRTLKEMIEAVGRVPEISREACRRHVEEHFSAARMTSAYEAVYQTLLVRAPQPVAA
ncbi:MAG: glycosyltransferase family 4 protein [Armatimonadota bacterium]|nr:glycosyltransferase family 4 protein [Armatimonadota bacterium]MDR7427149.1 glycosyltransferase family 4 protein [Armatimonadota bacterium]MDR7463985.1 glycosyltransferase family 4 protein [Armatimonadota bacterium]MDR7470454.1 glycosyltransferase family 4 protein [Armatimonadota bacterium]MDR7473568.1 glycosyltransferase family 4 protein [Armatimonadota bacterium]